MLRACAPSVLMTARPSATTRSRVSTRRLARASPGWLNHSASAAAIDVLHRGASPLIIDLSRVPFADAAGLAVMIGTQRRARLLGSGMLLAAPSPPVAALLRSTGLHRHFTIYPDIPAALASERNEPARAAISESAVS
jgi:anti-anti-sigma factor